MNKEIVKFSFHFPSLEETKHYSKAPSHPQDIEWMHTKEKKIVNYLKQEVVTLQEAAGVLNYAYDRIKAESSRADAYLDSEVSRILEDRVTLCFTRSNGEKTIVQMGKKVTEMLKEDHPTYTNMRIIIDNVYSLLGHETNFLPIS